MSTLNIKKWFISGQTLFGKPTPGGFEESGLSNLG
jgi:hypothetical protein